MLEVQILGVILYRMTFGGVGFIVLSCRYPSWEFLLLHEILAYGGNRNSFSMMHATCGGLVQGLCSVVDVFGEWSVIVGPEQRYKIKSNVEMFCNISC